MDYFGYVLLFMSCADPGIFSWGSRPDSQKTVWTTFFLFLNWFYSLQRRGSNGFIAEKTIYNLWFFRRVQTPYRPSGSAHVCHPVLSIPCRSVVACWERTLVCDHFVAFPYGVLGQEWYLIVSIPDPCHLPYFCTILTIVCCFIILACPRRKISESVHWNQNINPLFTVKKLANSEDPHKMQHNSAFHQGLQCLLRLKLFSGTKIHHN